MIYLGIDNGVSGFYAVLSQQGEVMAFDPMPTKKTLNYTKAKQWVTRLSFVRVNDIFYRLKDAKAAIERPMVMPGRFKATISAIRALEVVETALEIQEIPYQFIDSREWQKVLLPKGLEKGETKKASDEVCRRLFPGIPVKKSGDGDALLIAEHLRRKENGGIIK